MSSGSEQDAAELRRTSREVAKRLLDHEPSFAASGEVPPAVDDLLREMGYFALTIPEDYGGLNLGALATTAVLAELGSLPLSFFTDVRSNAGVGTRVLARHGSAAQKERWLRAAAAGTARTAFALTEPGAGSDAASIACSAERRGDSYVLNGTKQYITNGQRADIVTVLAYTDRTKGRRGMTAFLVQKGTPGFEVARLERTMAGPPDSVAQLRLTDCVVPADSVLGEVGQGFYYAMENLNEGRLYVAALAVGMARCAQEDASQYAKQRVAFGQPLVGFQTIRHMLADSATELHAAELMISDAASRHDRGEDVALQCAMTKLFSTEMAGRVVDRALQVHGGTGYMRGTRVERLYREARLLRIVEGTSEIQREIISRRVLT